MRNYPSTYTQERIEADLKNYEAVIVNLVVYDMSQAGEEFMSSFSENGISRNWRKRSELFVGVYPFAKVLQKIVRYRVCGSDAVAGGAH